MLTLQQANQILAGAIAKSKVRNFKPMGIAVLELQTAPADGYLLAKIPLGVLRLP